jgi:hypothetical protein
MHTTEHEILDALAEPCCAVCRLASAAARGYLQGVMRDGVNDRVVRNDWRRRGGLCAGHWRVWRALEAPALSSALLTRDLLDHALRQGSPKERDCRACRAEREAERRYLDALAAMPVAAIQAPLEQGRGFLCLRHLERLPASSLRAALEARLEAILAELSEFVRKSDYRFSHEARGPEGDSWLRAIRALGGDV